jgi:hypothetical protein
MLSLNNKRRKGQKGLNFKELIQGKFNNRYEAKFETDTSVLFKNKLT